jgi:hypothetical protein
MARRYNIDNYLIEMSASEAEQILGLSGRYSASEVKSSYRKMSLKHHPDKGGSTEMMKKVNAAYEMLKKGSSSRNSRPSRSSSDSMGEKTEQVEKQLDKVMKSASKEIIRRMKKFTGLSFKVKSFKIERSLKPLKVLAEMKLIAKNNDGGYDNIFFDMKTVIPDFLFPGYSTLVQVWIDGSHDGGEYFEKRLHSDSVRWKEIEFIKVDPKELIPEKMVKDHYQKYK